MRTKLLAASLATLAGCAASGAQFPLREALRRDTDLQAFHAPCRRDASGEKVCAPEEYVSPLVWDGADNMVFRPLADALAVEGESGAARQNSKNVQRGRARPAVQASW